MANQDQDRRYRAGLGLLGLLAESFVSYCILVCTELSCIANRWIVDLQRGMQLHQPPLRSDWPCAWRYDGQCPHVCASLAAMHRGIAYCLLLCLNGNPRRLEIIPSSPCFVRVLHQCAWGLRIHPWLHECKLLRSQVGTLDVLFSFAV